MSGDIAGLRSRQPLCRLLDIDPEIGAGLSQDAFAQARGHLIVSTLEVGERASAVIEDELRSSTYGLLVIDGYLTTTVTLGGRAASEILGPGDLLLPGMEAAVDGLGGVVRRALVPSQMAVLDREFATKVARWPHITRKLQERAAQRAGRLSLLRALMFHPRIEARLALLLHHLAQRWGRITPHGVRVPMPLTHDMLANLTGSARPSVSRALSRLHSDGIVARDGKNWRLLVTTSDVYQYVTRRIPPRVPVSLAPETVTISDRLVLEEDITVPPRGMGSALA
jgi:CRP/FNR family transcriptional regulator, cyclic AMP receptor protein